MKDAIKYIRTLWAILLYSIRRNKISITAEIGKGTFLRNCVIGKWCYIGPRCNINSTKIGNYSCIAPSCQIGGMEHPYWDLTISPKLTDQFIFGRETIIGHDVWIAADCVIKQGVSIGDGAVIGANTFVNKDIPRYAIAFGTPVKVIRYRFDEETIKILDQSHYWEFSPKDSKQMLKKVRGRT